MASNGRTGGTTVPTAVVTLVVTTSGYSTARAIHQLWNDDRNFRIVEWRNNGTVRIGTYVRKSGLARIMPTGVEVIAEYEPTLGMKPRTTILRAY